MSQILSNVIQILSELCLELAEREKIWFLHLESSGWRWRGGTNTPLGQDVKTTVSEGCHRRNHHLWAPVAGPDTGCGRKEKSMFLMKHGYKATAQAPWLELLPGPWHWYWGGIQEHWEQTGMKRTKGSRYWLYLLGDVGTVCLFEREGCGAIEDGNLEARCSLCSHPKAFSNLPQ